MSTNSIGPTGLTTMSQADLLAQFTTDLQAIYGAGINLDPSSPDGQWVNIMIQAILDVENLITLVNSMFDPDQAVGVVLDQRVGINGIQREAGTYTVTNCTLVISQAITLQGLDLFPNAPYTVQDNVGNNWQLQTTQNPSGSGTYVYAFQAQNPGAIQTTINTITVPVTIVLGVASINNPTTYSTLGINEETDSALKVRRQQSVSISSQGYFNGLLAALENINGVTSVEIFENDTGTTDINGVPGHSIWVIVAGSGAASAIANAIYSKRNAGCGMKGSQSYVITQADGSPFTILWDDVVAQNLFISFTATSLSGVNPPNIAAILAGLPTSFVPGVDQQVNINDLATAVQAIDSNTLVTFTGSGTPSVGGFSTSAMGAYSNTLTPSAKNYQFAVASSRIIILPMILSPTTVSVAPSGMQTFTGLGGYGTLTYTISVNNSGGSIVGGTGVYTAGATPNVVDTILVTDSLGNTATAAVSVT